MSDNSIHLDLSAVFSSIDKWLVWSLPDWTSTPFVNPWESGAIQHTLEPLFLFK
jgi:hypothetical protein